MTASDSNLLTAARALYVMGALLIVIPLSDALPAAWPLRIGAADWRFAVTGLLSGALMTPLLGAFLVLAAAAILGQRRVMAFGAWSLAVLAVVLLAAAVLFALDFLEVRSRVQEAARPAFLAAALKAIWKIGLGCVTSLVLALSARRMARRVANELAAFEQAPSVVVRPGHH